MRATDHRGFDSFYNDNVRRVASAAQLVAGDRHAGEDAAQVAFTKALERWVSVRSMESPVGWVITVAVNEAKRSARRQSRWWGVRESIEQASPNTYLSEDTLDLWEKIQTLPLRQRQALILRYYEDLAQRDVAKTLGIAEGTAAASLNHARAGLKSKLETRSTPE